MSRRDPKVIDAKLTNMFFFKHEKEELGELVKHISFFDFFKVCIFFNAVYGDCIDFDVKNVLLQTKMKEKQLGRVV